MANNVESRLNDALHNSVIFLTGVTGFVGKVTLARLLAVAPSLQRVYVLVRGRRGVSAAARFESVVLQSEALANVRELAVAKCVVLAGDASQAGVLDAAGVDASTRRAVFDSVDVILNCVGSLNYAEDLAAAVAANVRTAHHLIEFAQRIRSLRLFVHVSTAFVAAALPADSARPHSTRVPEQSDAFLPGIDSERLLARVPLMSAAQLARITPRVLGRFPNAHLFAKAVAEHLLLRTREAVPLLIVRPAHIGAAFADPLPGWIDSTRSIGAMVLLNGVGLVQRANVRADLLLDIVPVDFLANTLCAAAAAAMQPSAPPLPRYLHVASGARHPLTWEEARVFTNEYWRQHPSRRAIAPASLDFFSSELLYRMWFWASHDVPAATASIAATLVPTKANRARATELMHAADALNAIHFAFAPWRQHEWRFELAALPALMARFQGPRANVADSDGDIDVADDSGVPWDAAALDWRHYLGLFCYGVRRFMLGESDLQPPIELLLGSVLTKDAGAAQQQSLLARLFSDIAWARGSSNDLQYAIAPILSTSTPAASAAAVAAATAEAAALVASGGVPPANTSLSFRRGPRTPDDMMRVVLATDNVRAAIAAHPGGAVAGRREAENIIAQMGHTQSLSVSRVTAWFMRKVFRRLYSGIHVDRAGIARLREAVARGAVAFVPTHRSYVDFLLISYVCFEYNIPLPHIAAGEDFLAVLFVNWIFRNAGAFFIRRSFKDDPLYWEIFSSYVQTLVLDRVPVEFFIEGTRSRAGKTMFPKLGMLGILIEPCVAGTMDDITIAPIAISYEKVLEAHLYSYELLGAPKPRETFGNLLKARRVLQEDFGRINVTFGEFISVSQFKAQFSGPPRSLVRALALHVVHRLHKALVVTPCSLFAAVVLVYRRGIERRRLCEAVGWLRRACESRGAIVAHNGSPETAVDYAMRLHGDNVTEIRNGMIGPRTIDEDGAFDAKPFIVLAFYRNQLIHLFYVDALVAVVLNTLGARAPRAAVLAELDFLRTLLANEFPTEESPCAMVLFEASIAALVANGAVRAERADDAGGDELYTITASGLGPATFFCHMLWPFIDSYWVAALTLLCLAPNGSASQRELLGRMSFVAEQLVAEKKVSFPESCSMDVLGNAFHTYIELRIIAKKRLAASVARLVGTVPESVVLTPEYADGTRMQAFVDRLARLRQNVVVSRGLSVTSFSADFPFLARL
jgi:glycerol-3-phosphate O-acyltransferase/nucleoside-diphosphate-sugar epimerase